MLRNLHSNLGHRRLHQVQHEYGGHSEGMKSVVCIGLSSAFTLIRHA